MDNANDGATGPALRPPTVADAAQMWRIARASRALDLNSPYAYVLVGEHFTATSVVAVDAEGTVVAFVAAYVPPTEPDAVFVWQVAVDHAHRGTGLATRMLHDVVDAGRRLGARHLTATVTPSNEASRRLFRSIAAARATAFEESPHLDVSAFPDDVAHEPENRVRVGPFAPD